MKNNQRKQLLVAAAFLLLSLSAVLIAPGKDTDAFKNCSFSSPLVSRDGKILRILPLENGLHREKIEYEKIPEKVRQVFIRSEDKRFSFHPGVDPVSVARAFSDNLTSGKTVSGASTITMQLARQLVPHNGGLKGKMREAFSAVRYSMRFSKESVFMMWINTVPFGRNIEGIQSASRLYFGIGAEYLTEAQALVLAVVPRSPSVYDPVKFPENVVSAASELLLRCGSGITEDEIRKTVEEAGNHIKYFSWPFHAPHFCNRIEKMISSEDACSGEAVITTLDFELQSRLEAVLERRISEAGKFRISNGSGVIIDPETHEVLAYAGSADYFSLESEGMNDGVTALRQPGSTLKPFLYELALEKGFTPSTLLPDIPCEFGTGEVYIPQNFNNTFNGPVRLRDALGSSLNVPAVYTLEKLGVENFRKRLVELGFKSLAGKKDSAGLSLALGGAEVSLLELVNSYCIFSDNHKIMEPVFLTGSSRGRETADRNIIGMISHEESSVSSGYGGSFSSGIVDPDSALIIRDILTDPLSRTTGFGSSNVFKSDNEVMIKTGTSNQFNNIWAAGLMPDLAGGIWMGNFSGDTVIGAPGSSLPADALIEFFNASGGGGEFRRNGNTVKKEICAISGMLAGEYCSSVKTEIFKPGNIPAPCTFHTASGSSYPPQYSEWLSYRGINSDIVSDSNQSLEILSPINNASFILDPYFPGKDQMIKISVVSGRDEELILRLDSRVIGREKNAVSVMVRLEKGSHLITADDGSETRSISYEVR